MRLGKQGKRSLTPKMGERNGGAFRWPLRQPHRNQGVNFIRLDGSAQWAVYPSTLDRKGLVYDNSRAASSLFRYSSFWKDVNNQ